MVESQPGKVQTFDPSITLTNFSAETRDQLIFNENQLVLAKLQQPTATQATARSRQTVDQIVEFTNYRNSSGGLVYIDGSFQALSTSGVPTSDVNQVKIGFDIQVTTSSVIFWTTTFVASAEVFVEYSFEDVTWFSVGDVTWVSVFDDTIENFPGDSPPTGQFKFTGTFDGGEITARYWRIRSDAETNFISQSGSSPNIVLTVTANSTSFFPSTGNLFSGAGAATKFLSYTGKTASTFTGVSDDFNTARSQLINGIDSPYSGNGNFEITLFGDDILNFPIAGSARLTKPAGTTFDLTTPRDIVTWTGKVDASNTLTGVSFNVGMFEEVSVTFSPFSYLFHEALSAGNVFFLTYNPYTLVFDSPLVNLNAFANNVTEVQVIPTVLPQLKHWNSAGSEAVGVLVEGTDYYTAAYDKADDAYYMIRFNDSVVGATVDPNDNFDADTGLGFDADKWTESTTNVYFQHNTASGTLDFKSSGGAGQLTSNYVVDGDFDAEIEFVSIGSLGEKAYFSLEAKSGSTGNVHMVSAMRGSYIPGVSTVSGTFSGATMTFTDTVGGAALLQGFRVDPTAVDFGFAGGVLNYDFVYNAANGVYDTTVSGISHDPVFPGIPYTMDSASLTISNLTTPADGQGFSVQVFVDETSITGALVSGVALQIERIGTNAYVRYDDADTPGVFDLLFVGNTPADDMKVQLFGDPASQTVDVAADNFLLTGTVVFNTPVFSVVTVDKQGNLVQVPSVSDSSGTVIQKLDLIRNPSATYTDFLSPRVEIATNGALVGAGGEIYIKVNGDLYRYVKTALPLLAVEDGSSASASTSGEIPATGVTTFAYNGYTQGGLSYIEFDSDLSTVFVRTITADTLLATAFKAGLDVTANDKPFAWNVTDLATLYYVDGTALKLYDLNETKAGFVNVTSDKQVLAAGTAETATITAQVLNVYGEPKSNKSMTFTVSAGDGAISPAIGCSDVNGEDTTVYTVGSAVGTATITTTVSDLTC